MRKKKLKNKKLSYSFLVLFNLNILTSEASARCYRKTRQIFKKGIVEDSKILLLKKK